ncbi:ATP-binding cassette domain-containing protein [Janibacter melonis]|uniref:ABC transporter ATP-binding protein n=1 Tax=Janibacter melonis TaxID=262209 RepID=UPI002043983D|nr:ATP-binding cassette domain-containing protein [Janibacter melonis]MCM3556675.1 ATP-binding cassette domain-containing protein [Janibacter melonis]
MRLSLEDVTLRRGRRDVLKGLSWTPPAGGRTLLLGRNGAGKTTTLKIASGALRPRSGTVTINGEPASSRDLRRSVAMMQQHISAVPKLTVLEQVAFAAWLAGRSQSQAHAAAQDAIEQVDLTRKADADPTRLSGGELRRVGLAEALARPSEVLLLDEPTAGLDPTQRSRFRDLLLALERPTVLSTHQLDDVDELFTAVSVLEDGRIVFDGSIEDYLRLGSGRDVARQAESAFASLTGDA